MTPAGRLPTVAGVGTRPKAATLRVAAAMAAVQVVAGFGAASGQSDRRGIDAAGLLLLLAGPAAFVLRDRWPLLAAAVAAAAADVSIARGYPFGPIFLSVVVSLVAAVADGRRRGAWALAAAGVAATAVATEVDPRGSGFDLLHLGLVAGWVVGVLAVGEVVRVRREQAGERARAADDERRRRAGEQRLALAQELHDVLAHHISLINVQASVALHLADTDPDRVRPALASIKEASRESLHQLRTALDVLRRGEAAPRAPAPRLADVAALVDSVRASGLAVDLDHAGEVGPLPAAVELAAYRIVQEALTNVARHAAARHATVRVARDAGGLTVEVRDDGAATPAAPPAAGNGLRGMHERARALGGTVEAGPRPDGGFAVVARLPA